MEEHEGYIRLVSNILAQAIEDYKLLKTINAIDAKGNVDITMWARRACGAECKPRGIGIAEAHQLVHFFNSTALIKMCQYTQVPVGSVKKSIGI